MGCLWASLAAAGVHVGGDVVVLAGTAGVLATIVPLVPGGLGLVEAVIPAVLHHFGAPLDAALAGALIYRAVATFLPAGIGAGIGAGVVGGLILARRRVPARRASSRIATDVILSDGAVSVEVDPPDGRS